MQAGKKKVAIMQPTVLPWIGYFDLIDQSDIFVYLDNVQFEKQSWQQRNRIRTFNGLEWITISALIGGRFGQAIKDVEINPVIFSSKFIKQMKQHYARASYFDRFFEEFSSIFEAAYGRGNLCDFNITMIEWICSKLELQKTFIRASNLLADGKRSQLLVGILEELGSNFYISPPGSSVYLEQERDIFDRAGISIHYQQYEHPVYKQVYDPFISHASCVDLLFNMGEDSLSVIRSGRRELVEAKRESIS